MVTLRERIIKNSVFYIVALISFLILAAIVFLFPLEFSGYKTTDILAPFWYVITETGGWVGGIFIFIVLFIYLFIYFKRSSRKHEDLIFFISVVIFTQFFLAGLSQFYVKDLFHKPRPNQLYLMNKGYLENEGTQFFSLSSEKRRAYLQEKIKPGDDSLIEIYPPILRNWVYDSGFSFPSGHSQTAFFLGTIIAFVFFKTFHGRKKNFYIIPFAWAVLVATSRVVIGIHYPIDVAGGAFFGMFAAMLILSTKKVNRIFQ